MNPIDRLTEAFEKFPGIGPRQARLLKEIKAKKGKIESKIRFMDMAKTYIEEGHEVCTRLALPIVSSQLLHRRRMCASRSLR